MDDTLLTEQLRQSHERNEALQGELASLRAALEPVVQSQQTIHRDYEALVDAARAVSEERDALRQRVAELEAANRRLVDMLWGRRSERRSESADQQHLNFGDELLDPPQRPGARDPCRPGPGGRRARSGVAQATGGTAQGPPG